MASTLAHPTAIVSQHCLYRFLHRKSEDSENRKTSLVLIGRVLAYVVQITFAQCISICYRQRIWRTFRSRALSIRSIDQLFSGIEDISLFVNWEAIANAPLVAGIALVVWLLPLATVIASPSALAFGWYPEVSDAFVSVPTVNFSKESYYDWRVPVKMPDATNMRSMIYYNTTSLIPKPDSFDYYDKPSLETQGLIWRTLFSSPDAVLNSTFNQNQEAARYQSCGGNYNCTYTINFLGPGYKCDDVTNLPGGLFNTSVLVPEGQHTYYTNVDTGDYERPQFKNLNPGVGGVPQGDIPDHAGDLRFEPEVWIGYAINTTKRLPDDSPFTKNWTHYYEPYIYRCIHYETKYTAAFNFTGQTCQIKSSSEFLAPILGVNFSLLNQGVLPVDDWISPRDNKIAYKKTAVYSALGEVFRGMLRGHIKLKPPIPGPTYLEMFSDITKTSLLSKNSAATKDFIQNLQIMYERIVLTLLTQPQMVVISEQEVLVHRIRNRVSFIYDPGRLWMCYGPIIFLTVIIIVIWVWTIWEDGTTFSTGFSRILATTRNSTLDEISRGACLGNDPFPQALMDRKLQFGALQNDTRLEDINSGFSGYETVGHCSFGVPTEVAPIRRDKIYTGIDAVGSEKRKEKAD
ncbi:hypothetical protein GQ44DRAFT_752888 [Phaeosphaeriaceae sp. PMI808]|nr:hypothetical protein GQ44DRAFT_752888 [Phaeosphaeriaceae sp. PMI808]